MTKDESSLIVAQMHAVAFAPAPPLAVPAFARTHPAAVPVFPETPVPDLPQIVLVDIALGKDLAVNVRACADGAVDQH